METFEHILTGGHPNSLGRTEEVVETILAEQKRLAELYECYSSADEVVRLRTSSAFKRIAKAQPEWLIPYFDRFLTEIAALDQASAQWTLAQLFEILEGLLTVEQKEQAKTLLKRNLVEHNDWIVLNMTMQTLADWTADDPELLTWLQPQLERLSQDSRKSVAKRATKLMGVLYE